MAHCDCEDYAGNNVAIVESIKDMKDFLTMNKTATIGALLHDRLHVFASADGPEADAERVSVIQSLAHLLGQVCAPFCFALPFFLLHVKSGTPFVWADHQHGCRHCDRQCDSLAGRGPFLHNTHWRIGTCLCIWIHRSRLHCDTHGGGGQGHPWDH